MFSIFFFIFVILGFTDKQINKISKMDGFEMRLESGGVGGLNSN